MSDQIIAYPEPQHVRQGELLRKQKRYPSKRVEPRVHAMLLLNSAHRGSEDHRQATTSRTRCCHKSGSTSCSNVLSSLMTEMIPVEVVSRLLMKRSDNRVKHLHTTTRRTLRPRNSPMIVEKQKNASASAFSEDTVSVLTNRLLNRYRSTQLLDRLQTQSTEVPRSHSCPGAHS